MAVTARKLRRLPTKTIELELARRQRDVGRLLQLRIALKKKIRTIDEEIRHNGGIHEHAAQRPSNKLNLVDSLIKLLNDRTLNVTSIAKEVQDAGYKTTSHNFRTIVNQTLIDSGKFKRVARGQYTVK